MSTVVRVLMRYSFSLILTGAILLSASETMGAPKLDWKEGERLLLQRHEGYFKRDADGTVLPYLDGVQFSFMASKGTEFLEFENGRLDFVSDLDADFLDRVLTDQGQLEEAYAGSMQLLRGPYFNTEYLGINLEAAQAKGSPLADLRVRKALNIDDEADVIRTVRGAGYAFEAPA